MKYKITLMGYPLSVRMFELGNQFVQCCLQFDSLEELWYEYEENGEEYNVEGEFISCDDCFKLEVENENGEIVYESASLDDIKQYPYYDEEDNAIIPNGYQFKGVEDGCYLVNQDTMKGSFWEIKLEIEGDFEPSRLYLVQSEVLDSEFRINDCFPMGVIYYQKGNEVNLESDRIDMEFVSDNGSYGYSISIASVKEKDWWTVLKE